MIDVRNLGVYINETGLGGYVQTCSIVVRTVGMVHMAKQYHTSTLLWLFLLSCCEMFRGSGRFDSVAGCSRTFLALAENRAQWLKMGVFM